MQHPQLRDDDDDDDDADYDDAERTENKQPYFKSVEEKKKKKRSSVASARISCAWRRGGDSWEVKQTLQRTAPSDEQLPGAGQLDWNASDTDRQKTKKTRQPSSPSVLSSAPREQKSHPAGHELEEWGVMVVQLGRGGYGTSLFVELF